MRSSFNAYGTSKNGYGDLHVPVWAGFPGTVPVGGMLDSNYLFAGALYGAGTPVLLKDKKITPFIGFEVVAFTAATGSETYDTIVVKPAKLGNVEIAPEADDVIQKVGATFATQGAARAVYSSTLITEGTNAGAYTVLIAHSANLGTLAAGDVLAPSAGAAGASGKSLAVQPNGYLYNDIYLGDIDVTADDAFATGAVVQHMENGAILINRTPAAPLAAQMLAAVPGVSQDFN